MTDIDALKKYLLIDKSSLDDELAHQSEIFYRIAEAYVEAVAKRDMLKEDMATVDAMLDGQIRATAAEKITEAQVKSKIQLDPTHQAASNSYFDAKTRADLLGALKEAFGQRSYLIRDLCQLYISNYYGANAVQGTSGTDAVAYRQRRHRLAEAREKRS